MTNRLVALDWMRGIVMILMAIDHASGAFNKDRLFTDSFFMYESGMALPAAQFLTRWITHICAPTFLFLAGTALALSIERRIKSGDNSWAIDRRLLIRGSIIAALDVFLMGWFWTPGSVLLQVLYAIGFSIILMIPIRRLSNRWLLCIAIGYFLLNDLLAAFILSITDNRLTVVGGLFFHGGEFTGLVIGYPVFPWLAIMMMGWVFGRYLITIRDVSKPLWTRARMLLISGFASLCLFVIVRGMNGYGNFMLPREDNSLIQWLHLCKYPPSLSFVALELGLMCVILSLLFKFQVRVADRIRRNNPILVFGQTALFFYLLHVVILELSAHALGLHKEMGLGATWMAAGAVLILLYPFCRWYRTYKTAHSLSWVRYI